MLIYKYIKDNLRRDVQYTWHTLYSDPSNVCLCSWALVSYNLVSWQRQLWIALSLGCHCFVLFPFKANRYFVGCFKWIVKLVCFWPSWAQCSLIHRDCAALGALSFTRKRFKCPLWFLVDDRGGLFVVLSWKLLSFSPPAFKKTNEVVIKAFQSIFCNRMMVKRRRRRRGGGM